MATATTVLRVVSEFIGIFWSDEFIFIVLGGLEELSHGSRLRFRIKVFLFRCYLRMLQHLNSSVKKNTPIIKILIKCFFFIQIDFYPF